MRSMLPHTQAVYPNREDRCLLADLWRPADVPVFGVSSADILSNPDPGWGTRTGMRAMGGRHIRLSRSRLLRLYTLQGSTQNFFALSLLLSSSSQHAQPPHRPRWRTRVTECRPSFRFELGGFLQGSNSSSYHRLDVQRWYRPMDRVPSTPIGQRSGESPEAIRHSIAMTPRSTLEPPPLGLG